MRTFIAHDPDAGLGGTDYLIRTFDDGTGDFATRPGLNRRWISWSAPTLMRTVD